MGSKDPYKSIFGSNATDRSVMTPDELDLLDGLCQEADNHRHLTMERASVVLIARLARELGDCRKRATPSPSMGKPGELPHHLRGEERELYIHRHDCPVAWASYDKHVLGLLERPSCFACGKIGDRAVEHLELADIYICVACKAKLDAPAAPSPATPEAEGPTSAPYPHYCRIHRAYYGSPTDTIPATMCPLCGIKAELVAQPAPRTYEACRALSWVDAVESSGAYMPVVNPIALLQSVNHIKKALATYHRLRANKEPAVDALKSIDNAIFNEEHLLNAIAAAPVASPPAAQEQKPVALLKELRANLIPDYWAEDSDYATQLDACIAYFASPTPASGWVQKSAAMEVTKYAWEHADWEWSAVAEGVRSRLDDSDWCLSCELAVAPGETK